MTTSAPSLGEVAMRRLRDLRISQGLSVPQFVTRCRQQGATWVTTNLIHNIELHRKRPRGLTLEELFVFCQVLGVPPIAVLTPTGDDDVIAVTPKTHRKAVDVRAWIRGERPLNPDQERTYYPALPESEWSTFVTGGTHAKSEGLLSASFGPPQRRPGDH